jgi:hypothetical protein
LDLIANFRVRVFTKGSVLLTRSLDRVGLLRLSESPSRTLKRFLQTIQLLPKKHHKNSGFFCQEGRIFGGFLLKLEAILTRFLVGKM